MDRCRNFGNECGAVNCDVLKGFLWGACSMLLFTTIILHDSFENADVYSPADVRKVLVKNGLAEYKDTGSKLSVVLKDLK